MSERALHRVACVDAPALPLQLLQRARPEWRGAPLAVVEEDHPQALILWIDAMAAKKGVRVGMRYAAALELCRELRASPVPSAMIDRAKRELIEALTRFTPKVEPDGEREGVLWLDPSGLGSLFGPIERWASGVHAALRQLALRGAVVVGFARLPTWAVARMRAGPFVIESPAEEADLASRAPLAHLEIPPELRDALVALGITTLGGFLALPRGDIGQRFGPHARELHALFADALRPPMQAAQAEEPIFVEAELETPDDNLMRILFCIKGGLHALMADLARRSLALRALEVRLELEAAPRPIAASDARAIDFALERGRPGVPSGAREELRLNAHPSPENLPPSLLPRAGALTAAASTSASASSSTSAVKESERVVVAERIEPARATRDALSVLELVRLRFASVVLPARVEKIVLEAEPSRLDGAQLVLFAGRRHDPEAAARGIARLRASFGDDAVTRAALRDEWLPERAFAWEPTDTVSVPTGLASPPEGRLVRRVLSAPIELPSGSDGRPRTSPPIEAMVGPYRLQGGFWVGEVARDYFYAERADGALLWIYRDRHHGRWFLHGHLD